MKPHKRYTVTPRRQPGRKAFIANFYTATGARVTRGLGTEHETIAEQLCLCLQRLRESGITSRDQITPEMLISEDAKRLYFDEPRPQGDGSKPGVAGVAAEYVSRALLAVETYDAKDRPRLTRVFSELLTLRERVRDLSASNADLVTALEAERAAHQALKQTAIAKAVTAIQSAPPIADALKLFEEHMKAKTTPGNAARVLYEAKRFVATLPAEVVRPGDIQAHQVSTWLDADVQSSDTKKKAARRDHVRRRVGRFINWAADTWQYPSQMKYVDGVTRNAIERERGDIRWHTIEEVDAAITGVRERLIAFEKSRERKISDAELAPRVVYWQALIATLGFAGLQLAELVWARRGDLEFIQTKQGERAKLWVTTVQDHEDESVVHALKTAHRRRHVDIHPSRLLPRLKAHLERLPVMEGDGANAPLFPVPPWHAARLRKSSGSQTRWLTQTLSTLLRGHVGSADKLDRKPAAGLLPPSMNALSLRRTFGSLLLRSGKSTAEVAAAMGNTDDVVRSHYARILGCEVDVDF